MSSAADPPIIISGDSVTILFDVSQFQADGFGRFYSANKQIKYVEVMSENGVNIAEPIADGKVTIKIYYGSP